MPNYNPKTEHLQPWKYTTEWQFTNLVSRTLSIRLTPELDEYVREKTNNGRNQWLIEAISEKQEREKKVGVDDVGKRFKGLSSKIMSIKLPKDLDEYVREKASNSRNQWVISAVLEKYQKEIAKGT